MTRGHSTAGQAARDAQRPATFAMLAAHFFATFPQLEGVSFSHAWGGVIDTCTRFCPFFGTGYGGGLAYAAGYTGLGVGATRFGAQVMLDLLEGRIRTDPADSGHVQTGAVPAGTRQFGGCPADPLLARQGRPQRGPPRRVAAAAGPARPGVRLLAPSTPRLAPSTRGKVAGLTPAGHGYHEYPRRFDEGFPGRRVHMPRGGLERREAGRDPGSHQLLASRTLARAKDSAGAGTLRLGKSGRSQFDRMEIPG